MTSRIEKYHSLDNNEKTKSRSEKNHHLYQELYNNKVYMDYTDVENNVIDLENISSVKEVTKREEYQKRKMVQQEESFPKRTSFSSIDREGLHSLENKNYNINDILENAKKNRTDMDEEERKKHFKTVEYNILADLSKEKEKQEKAKKLSKSEEENLEELIHTITSNSLRKKIDDELLSDLLPSTESETIISKTLVGEEQEEQQERSEENIDEFENIDNSFYTKSMELSKEDFEFDEEEDDSFLEDSKFSKLNRILLIIFIVLAIAIIGYIIYIIL